MAELSGSGTPRTKDGKPDLLAKAPRLGGKPDLSGVWQVEPPGKGEIERMLGGDVIGYTVPGDDIRTFSRYFFNILADFKPEESSLRPEAAEILRSRSTNRITPDERCLPVGVPRADLIGFPFKIVQTPGLMVMLYKGDYTRRQIYTDGRHWIRTPHGWVTRSGAGKAIRWSWTRRVSATRSGLTLWDTRPASRVMDPKIWTKDWPSLRWWAALKMKESQCHEPEKVTRQA